MSETLFTSVFYGPHGDGAVMIGMVPISLSSRRGVEESVFLVISKEAEKLLALPRRRARHYHPHMRRTIESLGSSAAGGIFEASLLRHVFDFTHLPKLELVPRTIDTIIMVKTTRETYQLGITGCPKTNELAVFGKGAGARGFVNSIAGMVKPMGELTVGNYFYKVYRELEHVEGVPHGGSGQPVAAHV